jgi:hypothetical protein
MCSWWASGVDRADGHRNRMDLAAVTIWLRQCIEYSREQLRSLRR